MSQVLAEVLPNIKVCNIYINLPLGEKCNKVQICKSECILELDDESVVRISLPKGTYLVPDTKENVNQDGETVSVRVQMGEESSIISILGSELINDVETLSLDEPLREALTGKSIKGQCKKCSCCFQQPFTFRQVLPLPSVDWDGSSEGWFCHLHNEDRKKLKPVSLIPAPDQCFYSELFFLLNCASLDSLNLNCVDNVLKCTGCDEALGEKSNVLKLWTQTVVWISDDGHILFNKNTESVLQSLFRNIDKDNFGTSCRLVLSTAHPKLYLYMMTVNTNQKLFISDLQQITDTEQNQDSLLTKKARCDGNRGIKLRKLFAIKLLYRIKEGDDDESGSWHDDVNVHILPCSMAFFVGVRSLLEMSSAYLPLELRTFENMNVGYVIKS